LDFYFLTSSLTHPVIFFPSLLFSQEGAGAAALAAFVELVFDNTDNRFPVTFIFHFFTFILSWLN